MTVVEFALLAPVLLVTMMGLFDFSYNIYAESMIEGAVQKAARDSTIEQFANNPAALDTKVREAVQKVVPSSNVTFTRSAYRNYSDMGRAEEFTDTNGDGVCNNNETFVDLNSNGFWDSTRARDAANSARDAVLYEVNASYDRAFPLAGLLGFDDTVNVSARTVLRNQPFNMTEETFTTGNCA
ncbi:MAG: pilus assembly protein [Erythrobacter sp.]|nr:MAG: pilus assembly protein [Erythrobacter sp.]